MEENKNMPQSDHHSTENVVTAPVVERPHVADAGSHDVSLNSIKVVEKVTIWIMVLSTIVFALLCIAAIWGLFGSNQDNIIGRSLGTITVVAFAALIVNVGANILEHPKKK